MRFDRSDTIAWSSPTTIRCSAARCARRSPALFERVEIAEAGTFDEVSKLLDTGGEVDLILLDLTMPGVRGFSGLMYLRAQYPERAGRGGVGQRRSVGDPPLHGFRRLRLHPEDARHRGDARRRSRACSRAGCGRRPTSISTAGSDAETAALMARLATLTPQQVRVLMMLSEGLLNKQIAYELTVSEATVKAHVSAILQKLGVESRTQAVIAAAKIEVGQWPQARRLTARLDISSACRDRLSRHRKRSYADTKRATLRIVHNLQGRDKPKSRRRCGNVAKLSTPPRPRAARAIAPAARAAPPASAAC